MDSLTPKKKNNRLLSLLSIQGGIANIGWVLGSPSIVITYIAVAHDIPIILAGILATVRKSGNMIVDIFAGDLAQHRANKTRDIAMADIVLAICFLIAISSIMYGTLWAVTIGLLFAMLCIGIASEIQGIIFSDYIGDTLQSNERTRLEYWVMGLGGIGAALFAWPVHWMMLEYPPLSRHSTMIFIATACFCASAFLLVTGRVWLTRWSATGASAQSGSEDKSDVREGLWTRYRNLARSSWFRKFMAVRLMLQSVELSLPFFAILAALAHHESRHGLTALVISSALALTVAGPLWRSLSSKSHGQVMIVACSIAAISGMTLVGNHFLQLVNTIYLHATALFLVMVAVEGVSTAQSLFYLDIAPRDQRVAGLAVSKSVVRTAAIIFTACMATLAHMQHVVWAILLIALLNIATAFICYWATSTTVHDPENA